MLERRVILCMTAWIVFLLWQDGRHAVGQGMLSELKREVKDGDPKKERDDDDDDDHHDYDHHDDYDHHYSIFDPFGEVIGEVLVAAATSPFWVPRDLVQDSGLDDGRFLCYPYQSGFDGYLLNNNSDQFIDTNYPWLLRLQGEYGEDFDSIRRASMRVLYETSSRLGADLSIDYYREWLGIGARDDLWLGDANVVYRFAQSDRLLMRAGIGMNYLTGSGFTDLGFNFTYGGDWFPVRPWIVSADIDVGTLGKADFFHGRVTVGVNVRKVEFYSGYDYLDVGSTQIGTVIGGIRLWY